MKGFLQIHDPLKPQGSVVGIDLGTTNSLVAAVINGKAQCLAADDGGFKLLPSVVHYAANGAVLVGRHAVDQLASFPTDTIKSVKRFMGKSLGDVETKKLGAYKFVSGSGVVRFDVAGGQPVTPIEVSGEILRQLKRRAESHFAGKVEKAVITVPAYFDDAQRQAHQQLAVAAEVDRVDPALRELEALEVEDDIAGEERNAGGKLHFELGFDRHVLRVERLAVLVDDVDRELVAAGVFRGEAEAEREAAARVHDRELAGGESVEGAGDDELAVVVRGEVAKGGDLDVHGR